MFSADVLTLQEFLMRETLPLATIHGAVLEFLHGRDDVAVSGAQAVNAYVPEPRMTQDVDLVSPRAAEFAEELRQYLSQKFHVAVRVGEIGGGKGYRLYQVQKPGNRHLADVRPVEVLPAVERIEGVPVVAPAELIAAKVIAYHRRRDKPKSGTDWRDLAVLLLAFPELKRASGPVLDVLERLGADQATLEVWQALAERTIQPPDEDDEF